MFAGWISVSLLFRLKLNQPCKIYFYFSFTSTWNSAYLILSSTWNRIFSRVGALCLYIIVFISNVCIFRSTSLPLHYHIFTIACFVLCWWYSIFVVTVVVVNDVVVDFITIANAVIIIVVVVGIYVMCIYSR